MTVSPQQNIPFIAQEQPDGADFNPGERESTTVNMFLSRNEGIQTEIH